MIYSCDHPECFPRQRVWAPSGGWRLRVRKRIPKRTGVWRLRARKRPVMGISCISIEPYYDAAGVSIDHGVVGVTTGQVGRWDRSVSRGGFDVLV
jgi:hypothetical protein